MSCEVAIAKAEEALTTAREAKAAADHAVQTSQEVRESFLEHRLSIEQNVANATATMLDELRELRRWLNRRLNAIERAVGVTGRVVVPIRDDDPEAC